MFRLTSFHLAAGVLLLSPAAPAGEHVSARGVPAVLEARCVKCHGPDEAKSGLRLDSVLSALRGGDSGERTILPGDSSKSELIARVVSADEDRRMPPKGAALGGEEIAALRQWIDQRENWTAATAELERRTTDHWSYQPVVRPPLPDTGHGHPIDAFVAAALSERGLDFNPAASAEALLRRMSLVVTGLLPDEESPGEFFEAYGGGGEEAAAAVEALADRLLASPHFGERWARHWLDVVRYADSHGFETNHERPNAYPYRDWVIRAFNEDKPYDRFVFEQIAGDTAGEDAATGFLVAGPWDRVKGQDPLLREMQRQDELSDLVDAVGTAFLGTTMVCAKCHNHKFDPVSQTDFYAMQAVFEGVRHGERDLRSAETAGRQARAESLAREIETLRMDLEVLLPRPYSGPTLFIDEADPVRSLPLEKPKGEGKNPQGTARGHLGDPGGTGRLPNVAGGGYLWWENAPGRDVLAYRPGVVGDWRIWLSWGGGFPTHTADARYVLDLDGDPATTGDQTEIARIDQRNFADCAGTDGAKPLWSGFFDAGVHALTLSSAILVRGGNTGGAITADAIVLQRPEAGGIQPRLRPPVEAKRNEETFAPVETRFVRFAIESTNGGQPCLDELEVWSGERNVALGAKPGSSGDFAGNPKHRLAHLNDGRYGNDRSWIADTVAGAWAMLELPATETIDRIVWSRDRDGKYRDRLATAYRIEVAGSEAGPWTRVASSEDRAPFGSPPSDELAYRLAGLDAAPSSEVRSAQARLVELENERAALLVPPKVYAGEFVQPERPTRRLFRGDPLSPKEVVAPASPAVFAQMLKGFSLDAEAPEAGRRVALANWIANPANPLTARVAVNRIWQHHFGRGLVATPSDFGTMGFRPTHPDLLDWLAAELVDGGWSLKRIHRLILTSRTFRQSSAPRSEALAADAGCELLWRFPPRRLEGEAIRDIVLQVAGTLDRRMFGPGFLLFEPNTNYARNWIAKDEFSPDDHRRMVYAMQLRMEHDAVFGAFDCPDGGQAMPARSRSTTPIQALNLYNSPFAIAQAGRFAERVRAESGSGSDDPAVLADRAFRIAFGRSCEGPEREDAVRLVAEHGLESLCRALINSNELLFVP